MLDTCLCSNLRMATRVITRVYDEALRPLGITSNQLQLMTAIVIADGANVSEIGARLSTDPSTVGRELRSLVSNGLVERTTGKDRRARIVRLTAAGVALHRRARPLWAKAQAQVAEALGTVGFERLRDDLAQVSETAAEEE